MTRQMVMVGFLQAQNCTNLPASWRHPEGRTDSMSPRYYQEIGRVLEEGKFHLAFFDDRLAMPDRYGDDHAAAVAHGIRCIKMDPVPVLMAMAAATERLGLGATCSTTYYEPFHVARLFSTIDMMTDGRAAWNVVTSLNDGEAMNMGRSAVMEHDHRYNRADEFMEVVLGHWDSWDDDALILDKASGRFADAAKVRRLDHAGEFFRSRGPFTVPRTPQGHPVIIQAGQSGRGRRFAGRWGEVIFATATSVAHGREVYAALAHGFVIAEGAGVLLLESLTHARRRGAEILAEVAGFGMTADGYHLTAPHPEADGAIRAIRLALEDARLNPGDVDYINAHGTSTPLNDLLETRAVKQVFGDHARRLAISSIKSMVGHCLGGSAGLEAVASVLTLRHGILPPTINLTEPDPELDLDYVPLHARERPVRAVLSNSFAFGGHNAVIAFTRAE